MKDKNTQKEVEELVALMFPNQFLQRDLKKLETIFNAGYVKGLEESRKIIEKHLNKQPK